MLSADDASKLTVPLAIYISQDEPVDEVSLKLMSPCSCELTVLPVHQNRRHPKQQAVLSSMRLQKL